MTEQNLIINGVDHAKFDLEWARLVGFCLIQSRFSRSFAVKDRPRKA